ncbi:MAG: hypothetical protein LBU44_04705, partial [Mediterranea sp.]|nr:hypothetical protein [Mediterranea sp.]
STVQYNALQSVDWRFTPVTKVVTQTRKRVFDPFISAGWSTLGYMSVGAGVFYHNLGVEYRYLRGYNGGNDGHAVGMKWRL